ncbi:MAG: trigger factor [Ferrovum sp.]|nr:trigger factor [Ferrovum sp.]NDU88252.1 trigger factor [Ferrovum sp.]
MDTAPQNPLERRLQLNIPLTLVQQETEGRLRKIARTTRMQGFRPGKVPYRLVVQQYGAQAEEEALNQLAQARFSEEIRTLQWRVAGRPNFEAVTSSDANSFEFSALFEVYPEVTLGSLAGRSLVRPVVTVTEADIDRTLEILQRQRVSYVMTDRPAANEDRVTVDFVGTLDGEEFPGGTGKQVPLVLGSGRFLATFEQALVGLTAGQETTFPLEFPADYQAAHLAGKTVTFRVTVGEVAAPVLPQLDDEFLRSVGVSSGGVEELRKELRENLEREVRQKVRGQIKDKALSLLHEVTPTPVPQALIQYEVERMRNEALEELGSQGNPMTASQLPDSLFVAKAERRVALGLIVAALVECEKLTTTAEQVRHLIEEVAEAYERPDEVVSWYYQQPQRLQEVESLALEERVVEWIYTQVQTEEVAVSFEELTRAPQ